MLPLPRSFSPLVTPGLFSMPVSLPLLLYSLVCCIFLIPYAKFVFLCLTYFTLALCPPSPSMLLQMTEFNYFPLCVCVYI